MRQIEALAFVLQVSYLVGDVLELPLETVDYGLHFFNNSLRLIDVFIEFECLLIQAHKVEGALILQLVELGFDLLGVGPDIEGLPSLPSSLGSQRAPLELCRAISACPSGSNDFVKETPVLRCSP